MNVMRLIPGSIEMSMNHKLRPRLYIRFGFLSRSVTFLFLGPEDPAPPNMSAYSEDRSIVLYISVSFLFLIPMFHA